MKCHNCTHAQVCSWVDKMQTLDDQVVKMEIDLVETPFSLRVLCERQTTLPIVERARGS